MRTWGNEGNCSVNQQELANKRLVVRLPPPPSTAVNETGTTATWGKLKGYNGVDVGALSAAADDTGFYITSDGWPSPENKPAIAGEVTLHWQVAVGATLAPQNAHSNPPPPPGHGPDTGEPEQRYRAAAERLTPSQQELYQRAAGPNVVKPFSAPVDLKAPEITHAIPQPPAAVPPEKQVYDPSHVTEIIRQYYALCVASDRLLPKPESCGLPANYNPKTSGPASPMPVPQVVRVSGDPSAGTIAAGRPVSRASTGGSRWLWVGIVAAGLLAVGGVALVIRSRLRS